MAVRRALLLTDIVDSTRLSESLGDAQMAALWAAHDRVARDLLVVHRGREIDKTDGFLLLFDDATDAAAYAVAYHRDLHVNLGEAYRNLGDLERAAEHGSRGLALHRERGSLRFIGTALNNLAIVSIQRGDLEAGLAQLAEAQEVMDRAGLRGLTPMLVANRGKVLLRMGRNAEGRAALAASVDASADLGYWSAAVAVAADLMRTCVDLGDLVAARQALQRAEAWVSEQGFAPDDRVVQHLAEARSQLEAAEGSSPRRRPAEVAMVRAQPARIQRRPPSSWGARGAPPASSTRWPIGADLP